MVRPYISLSPGLWNVITKLPSRTPAVFLIIPLLPFRRCQGAVARVVAWYHATEVTDQFHLTPTSQLAPRATTDPAEHLGRTKYWF